MKKTLLSIAFALVIQASFGQSNSNGNDHLATSDAVQFDYNRSVNKRVGQTFLAMKSGTLESITIKLRGERGTAQGGKLTLDLFEISNSLQPIYKGSSEYKGYFYNSSKEGRDNVMLFGPGIEIRQGMAYYFVIRSNNFFQIVGGNNSNDNITINGNTRPTRVAVFINKPYNRIEDVNTAQDLQAAQPLANEFNMYYKINLK